MTARSLSLVQMWLLQWVQVKTAGAGAVVPMTEKCWGQVAVIVMVVEMVAATALGVVLMVSTIHGGAMVSM